MRIRWLTMNDTLARTGGELRGLMIVRVVLISALFVSQGAQVSVSFMTLFSTPLWIVPALATSSLFAASGFVLAQARERDPPLTFLARRVAFGWPPLAATVLLTAFVIGPAATTQGLGGYLRDPQTWLYLLNLFGLPRFDIPGVFEFNDLAGVVNPIVWTPPVYAAVVLLIAFTPSRLRNRIWGALALALVSTGVFATVAGIAVGRGQTVLAHAAPMMAAAVCAQIGALAYVNRERVPLDWRLAVVGAVIIAGVASAGNRFWDREPLVAVVLASPVSYLTLWITIRRSGFGDHWRRLQPFLAPALLGAFPIQQAVVALGPRGQDVFLNSVLSLPPTLLFAGVVGLALRRHRLSPEPRVHPWTATSQEVGRRRSAPLRERLRTMAWSALLGVTLLALTLALFALTLFALQRDPGGV